MSINSIKNRITGITDGGLNTAAEMRNVLNDITDTFSAATASTSSYTLDFVTSNGNSTVNTISVSGITTENINLSTNPGTFSNTTGSIEWNSIEDTIDLHASDGVIYQLGQEISPLVRNSSGSNISNGTPVMFAGTQGNTGRVLIQPAISDSSIISSYILGLTTQDIDNNSDGHVTWFGKVRGIDTTGALYGETWNDSDILYVSPITAGYLTNIKPEAPNLQIFIGVVVNAHVSEGTIFVRPSWRGKLTDLDDVNGTPLNATGLLCVWDNDLGVFDFTSNINDFLSSTGSTTSQLINNGSDGINPFITNLDLSGTTEFGGTIKTQPYTVETLPVGEEGMKAYVTDANSTTFYSIVVGGGSNVVPVFYNGVNWVIA